MEESGAEPLNIDARASLRPHVLHIVPLDESEVSQGEDHGSLT